MKILMMRNLGLEITLFKEWVKIKKGHLDISKSVRKDLFRLWVIDQFVEALYPDKDPLERCLDEYNWLFYKEIEQLANEYEIKIREEGDQKLGGTYRDRLDSYSCGNLAKSVAVTA
ncbi:hypothetical protein Tco_0694321 [Tanacetum coccineum]